jgi:serine/threonine protein kinase
MPHEEMSAPPASAPPEREQVLESLDSNRFCIAVGSQRYEIDGCTLKKVGDHPDFISYKLKPVVSEGTDPATVCDMVLKHPSLRSGGPSPREIQREIGEQEEAIERMRELPSTPDYVRNLRDTPEARRVVRIERGSGDEKPPDLTKYTVVRRYIDGVLLSDWMESYEKAANRGKEKFSGILDPKHWFKMTRLLVRALIPIHDVRLVHGDLRPRSIILKGPIGDWLGDELKDRTSDEVILLDTEDDTPPVYPSNSAQTGTFRRKYDSPLKLFEKRGASTPYRFVETTAPWFAPTDLFSLAMILFELACGSEAKLTPFLDEVRVEESTGPIWFKVGSYRARKTNAQLRKSVLDAVAKCVDADTALRMTEVILACLRTHTDASAADLRAIEWIIDEFDPFLEREPVEAGACETTLRVAFHNYVTAKLKNLPSCVESLIIRRGERSISQMSDMENERYLRFVRVFGRGQIMDALVTLLLSLGRGERCQALLTPDFFSEKNVGRLGKVTTALQLAALRGVKIEWIVAVHEEHLYGPEVAPVLQAHKMADEYVKDARSQALKNGSRAVAEAIEDYGISYSVAMKHEWVDLLKNQRTSIVIPQPSREGEPGEEHNYGILIAPDYHGDSGQIAALRIWPESKGSRHVLLNKTFKEFEKRKMGIGMYNR